MPRVETQDWHLALVTSNLVSTFQWRQASESSQLGNGRFAWNILEPDEVG